MNHIIGTLDSLNRVLAFTPEYNLIFGVIIALVTFIIFIKANNLYSKTKDPRMAIIAGGFFFGGFFELVNSGYSYLYNFVDHQEIYKPFEFLYLLISNLFLAVSSFKSVFYGSQQYLTSQQNFRQKAYFNYLLAAFVLVLLVESGRLIPYDLFQRYIFEILLVNPAVGILNNIFYIMAAFVFIDLKQLQGQTKFSMLVLGFLVLGVGQIYLITPTYLVSIYRLYIHVAKIIGLLLILYGVEEIGLCLNRFSFRARFSVYPPLFLVFTYFIFTLLNTLFLQIKYPIYVDYIIFLFFIAAGMYQYFLSASLINPLTKIISIMENFKPNERVAELPVTSNDEMGILTEKFNEVALIVWNYTRQLEDSNNREKLLRKLIESTRTTLDIDEILDTICVEIAGLFNGDRVVIVEYPDKSDFKNWILRKEYMDEKYGEIVKKIFYKSMDKRFGEYWHTLLVEKGTVAIDNISESETPDYFRKAYSVIGAKSVIGAPIKRGNDVWGTINILKIGEYKEWSRSEVDLLSSIADQVYIAVKQAELYLTTKEQAERESELRDIISSMKSTMNINEIKKIFVTRIGRFFKADRVVFSEFDLQKGIFLPTDDFSQYLIDESIESLVGCDWNMPEVQPFIQLLLDKREIYFSSLGKYIKDNNFEGSEIERLFLLWGIKSNYNILIMYGQNIMGYFCIDYISNERVLRDEEIEFLRTLSNQAGISIYQSKLYETTRKQSDREFLLRKIIEVLRSSLDINETLNFICDEVGKLFNIQRAVITQYTVSEDSRKYEVRREYKILPSVKGLTDVPAYEHIGFHWIKMLYSAGKSINIDNIVKADVPDYFKQFYLDLGVKSMMGAPIKKEEDVWGAIILFEYNYYRKWTVEDKQLLDAISSQVYIAIKQAELYHNQKQIAEREKLLREIISNIKISQNLDNVYAYVIEKLSSVFNADRVIFFETSLNMLEKALVKHEYLKDKNNLTLEKIEIPESLIKSFQSRLMESTTLSVNNVSEFYLGHRQIQAFFELYSIKSFMSKPLLRTSKENKTLGFLMLCFSEPRVWSDEEKSLLETISEAVLNVIKEIMKLQEIDELRSIFTITLAHDIQVPLVGQQKALEYLSSRHSDEPIGKYLYFIEETIESNKNLFNLLSRILESYYYELGKKKLNLSKQIISISLINEIIDPLIELAETKSISIDIEVSDKVPEVFIDKNEIKKAIFNIVENAVTYTQFGGNIVISCFCQEPNVVICISDNGPGIPFEKREKLFERYAMAQLIERKIGAGLGLYYSKQIVEAHKGSIFYTTELGIGSTFCILLPMSG